MIRRLLVHWIATADDKLSIRDIIHLVSHPNANKSATTIRRPQCDPAYVEKRT